MFFIMYVRLNSPESSQKGPHMARLAIITPVQSHRRNLTRDVIVSLAQYGMHYRDVDEPITTNTLQLLLYKRPVKTLLGQPHTNKCSDSNSTFNIQVTSLNTRLIPTSMNSTSGSESHRDIHSLTTEMIFYRLHLTHYLSFTEWRTIISQHPAISPSHSFRIHSPTGILIRPPLVTTQTLPVPNLASTSHGSMTLCDSSSIQLTPHMFSHLMYDTYQTTTS